MDALIGFLTHMAPPHWLVLGLVLLIAEMATGTTYLLWPAVAAFVTALLSLLLPTTWAQDLGLFALLVIVLTGFGHPLVQRWREAGRASGLNERSQSLVGARGVITVFDNGAGSVKLGDTVWRAVSAEPLAPGEAVEVASVDGVTVHVKRAG